MSDHSAALGQSGQSKPQVRDAFSDFQALDWVFVALLYLLLIYMIIQVGMAVLQPGKIDFDFMPIVNGAPFLSVAWGGVRLDRRMRVLIDQLDFGAVVAFGSPSERNQLLNAIAKLSRWMKWAGATLVGVSMLLGILDYVGLLSGGNVDWANGRINDSGQQTYVYLQDFALMVVVCVPVAALAGSFIGKFVAYSRLIETLHGLGYSISGFSSDTGIRALRTFEDMYAYYARATVLLCFVLGAWWIVLTLHFPQFERYADWRTTLAGLWAISFLAYFLAVYLPTRAFRRQLDETQGGADAYAASINQLDLALSDQRMLMAKPPGSTIAERRNTDRRLAELNEVIAGLETNKLRRPILTPWFLNLWLVLNVVAFVAPPLLWSSGQFGGPEQPQQQNP